MLLTAAFVAAPRRGRTPLAWAAAAAVLAALAAVTAWRTDQLLALAAG
jgi:hypothetical protein